jgi:hypothetical protein
VLASFTAGIEKENSLIGREVEETQEAFPASSHRNYLSSQTAIPPKSMETIKMIIFMPLLKGAFRWLFMAMS